MAESAMMWLMRVLPWTPYRHDNPTSGPRIDCGVDLNRTCPLRTGQGAESQADFERTYLYFDTLGRRIRARINLVEFWMEHRNKELQHLNDAHQQRALGWLQYEISEEDLEEQISHMRLELMVLKSRAGVIRGSVIDNHKYLAHAKDVDLAVDQLIDELIRSYAILPVGMTACPEPTRGAKDARKSKQMLFRQGLIESHDAHFKGNAKGTARESSEDDGKHEDEESDSTTSEAPVTDDWVCLWCPITHEYFCEGEMKANHIVPLAVGEFNCDYLFSKSEDAEEHLLSPRNGLLMHDLFKKATDKAQIAILLMDGPSFTVNDLKVVVLDRCLLKRRSSPGYLLWARLAVRQLIFQSQHRPRLRYLYFTFLMALFRRRRYECAGWKRDLLIYAQGGMWGLPGGWLRGLTMRTLASRIGHEPDLETFPGTVDLPLRTDRDDVIDNTLVADEIYSSFEAEGPLAGVKKLA